MYPLPDVSEIEILHPMRRQAGWESKGKKASAAEVEPQTHRALISLKAGTHAALTGQYRTSRGPHVKEDKPSPFIKTRVVGGEILPCPPRVVPITMANRMVRWGPRHIVEPWCSSTGAHAFRLRGIFPPFSLFNIPPASYLQPRVGPARVGVHTFQSVRNISGCWLQAYLHLPGYASDLQ